MKRSLPTVTALAALLVAVAFAGVAGAAQLPDNRGYELVSPDINNASVSPPIGHALADGSAVQYQTVDAPDQAESATPINMVVSRRGPAGWSSKSFSPPVINPSNTYWPFQTYAIAPDLTQVIDASDQPLAGGTPPSGANLYIRRPDGTYVLLTTAGSPLIPFANIYQGPIVSWSTADLSHVFFQPVVAQLAEDPLPEANPGNTYEWTDGEVRLVGILPDGTPAERGAVLAVAGGPSEHSPLDPVSADGEYVLFSEGNAVGRFFGQNEPPLYLRERGERTVAVSASQRTVEPDPNPPAVPAPVGITADGSTVLFSSASELTDDAYTGRSGGVATDAGADLYSYDVASGELTDLTVDTRPADAATGAHVLGVYGATEDASFLYFVATGNLAPGATSGIPNLYVMHAGTIRFIASNPGLIGSSSFYVTPDGRHAAFLATGSLTGYDNTNPQTGSPEREVFEYSYDSASLVCASCRPSGEAPIGGASLAAPGGNMSGGPIPLPARTLSDDGSRVFFDSTDAVVPQASNGRENVYEYEGGAVHLISPGDGDSASTLIDASASGDDVFFTTHDELVPHGQGRVSMVYDARVGAGSAGVLPPAECSGEACLGAPSSRLSFSVRGSNSVDATGRLHVSGRKRVRGGKARLRIVLPAAGRVTVSGKGLRTAHGRRGSAGATTVAVSLRPGAERIRRRQGVFLTHAKVVFRSNGEGSSRATVALEFVAAAKKGGK